MVYYDGRHYDRRTQSITRDIPFWEKQAQRYGDPILEIGCGTGRIAIPLARAGFCLTGIDTAPSMLQTGKWKAGAEGVRLTWVEADCRNFDLDREFNLVIYPACAMSNLLTRIDLESCFACLRKHMNQESRLIIDVHNPNLDILLRNPNKRYPRANYDDPDGKGTITMTETSSYNAASQINEVRFYYRMPDGSEVTEKLPLRMFYPQELEALLKYNGFGVEQKYGDYDESPFESGSPMQIVVCRLQA